MKNDRQWWLLTALAIGLFAIVACGSQITQGKGAVYLIIDQLSASPGGGDETFGNILQSDVLTNGGIFEDPGRVQMRLGLKDAGPQEFLLAPTPPNYITITRYRVVFKRADGRNTPGVDVPHPFDGAATFTVVSAANPTTAGFTIVRAQAKLEPPLIALQSGGAIVISTIADVTFFGRDQTGQDVAVTGSISVNFANWADPQ